MGTRRINAKMAMASEETMIRLTAALEAMTNDREPNIKLEACPIRGGTVHWRHGYRK